MSQVISLSEVRARTHLVAVLSGEFGADGELDEQTVKKIERAIALTHQFRRSNPPQPYAFVFTDSSRYKKIEQRVCDAMRNKVMELDAYCRAVKVPPTDVELLTEEDRLAFLEAVQGEVTGRCLVLA